MSLYSYTLPSMLLLLSTAGTGCAALSGTRPHDMTVAEHDRAARRYQAKAVAADEEAHAGGRGAQWQRFVAQRSEALAAEHADAARRLEREVTAACPGGTDRIPAALSSLPVASVEPIREADVRKSFRSGRGYYPERLRGARLLLSQDGLDRDALSAALACARLQALAGTASKEQDVSPFVVRGSELTVSDRDAALAIEVRARGDDAAGEVLRRARLLASAVPGTR